MFDIFFGIGCLLFIVLNLIDIKLYQYARERGAGSNPTPLSGYLLAWKYRHTPKLKGPQ